MSWLGQNGASREDFASLSDAYASMYKAAEEADETTEVLQEDEQELEEGVLSRTWMGIKNSIGKDKPERSRGRSPEPQKKPLSKQEDHFMNHPSLKREEAEILNALQDAYAMMYEKKKDSDKCGEDTYWDKEEKKCKSKKKSSKTVVVRGGGYYGGGHHHGSNGGGDGEGETDGGDGGDGGGDGGGGGGE